MLYLSKRAATLLAVCLLVLVPSLLKYAQYQAGVNVGMWPLFWGPLLTPVLLRAREILAVKHCEFMLSKFHFDNSTECVLPTTTTQCNRGQLSIPITNVGVRVNVEINFFPFSLCLRVLAPVC